LNAVPRRLRTIADFGLLTCLSLGALFAGARAGLAPADTSQGVAVIFAPWTPAARTLTQSVDGGARFVRYGGLPFIAVVVPADAAYADRMLGGGAWLVVDPQALAACAAAFSSTGQSS
jgi:hypothetical protein